MEYNIVVDSCCDLTEQMKKSMHVTCVPLTMQLGSTEYLDDDTLDRNVFMQKMKACTERVGSASPSPFAFQEQFERLKTAFAVTLSSKLSGTYANAVMGKTFAEESTDTNIHIFDSKSASAGESLATLKLYKLIASGLSRERIVSSMNSFIDNMKTYFVLENYDNLQKNGRLNRLTGKIANILNIKLVMGADGDGNIGLYAKPRGIRRMIDQMLQLVKDSGKKTDNEDMVIAHCNNHALASQIADSIRNHFHFKEIHIIPTGGISTLYADDQGVILAF